MVTQKVKKNTLIAIALLMVIFSMGAEGCQDQGGSKGAGPPPRVPEPNPDTKARPPGTPKPGAGDPKPEDCHQYSVFATWAPVKEFVRIDWDIGPHEGTEHERTGGEWSKTKTVCGDAGAFIKVQWTKISKDNMIRKSVNGQLTATLLIDGHPAGVGPGNVAFGPNAVATAKFN